MYHTHTVHTHTVHTHILFTHTYTYTLGWTFDNCCLQERMIGDDPCLTEHTGKGSAFRLAEVSRIWRRQLKMRLRKSSDTGIAGTRWLMSSLSTHGSEDEWILEKEILVRNYDLTTARAWLKLRNAQVLTSQSRKIPFRHDTEFLHFGYYLKERFPLAPCPEGTHEVLQLTLVFLLIEAETTQGSPWQETGSAHMACLTPLFHKATTKRI